MLEKKILANLALNEGCVAVKALGIVVCRDDSSLTARPS